MVVKSLASSMQEIDAYETEVIAATGEVDQGQDIETAMNRGNMIVMAGHYNSDGKRGVHAVT